MKYIIANWKLYLSPSQSVALAKKLVADYKNGQEARLVLCPSFDALGEVGKIIKISNFNLGAQDVFWEERGAFTGEESINSLKSLGCKFVIVGHSERRRLGETDEIIAKKLITTAVAGLTPVLCVGETKDELDAGTKEEVIKRQLIIALSGLKSKSHKLKELIIAYEPVWAIGTGIPETPKNARSSHRFIRELLDKNFLKFSKVTHIIYGGSVNSENIHGFLKFSEIDGALVGGASIKATEFMKIIKTLGA